MRLNEKQFRDHENLRDDLRKILSGEVMTTVLAIVEDRAKPRGLPEPRPNAHLDTLTTQKYCRLQGVQSVVDLLWSLTEPNPVVADTEEKDDLSKQDFFHALPKEMQDALRKRAAEGK